MRPVVDSLIKVITKGLDELDKFEEFFTSRGLEVPADAAKSINAKRRNLTKQLERIKNAYHQE